MGGKLSCFREAVNDIGIGDLTILKPMGYYDVSYWDWAVYASDEMKELKEGSLASGLPASSPHGLRLQHPIALRLMISRPPFTESGATDYVTFSHSGLTLGTRGTSL